MPVLPGENHAVLPVEGEDRCPLAGSDPGVALRLTGRVPDLILDYLESAVEHHFTRKYLLIHLNPPAMNLARRLNWESPMR